jgi:hypothetical protein
MLREGIEDYEYLTTLRDLVTRAKAAGKPDTAAEALLKIPESIYSSMTKYTVDPAPIYAHRHLVAEAIERLSRPR